MRTAHSYCAIYTRAPFLATACYTIVFSLARLPTRAVGVVNQICHAAGGLCHNHRGVLATSGFVGALKVILGTGRFDFWIGVAAATELIFGAVEVSMWPNWGI
jgi:hypothetical protein